MTTNGAGGDRGLPDTAPLDAAAGTACAWVSLSVPDEHRGGYLLVGAPKNVPAEALAALRSLLNHVTLAPRNSDVRAELSAQARTDNLTGLANRAAFTAALSTLLDEPARQSAALLFVDLDDFKTVNDALGHRR